MNPPARRPGHATATADPVADPDRGRIHCEGLVRIFRVADLEVVALQGLDLLVEPGELVAVVGASGSGKSTLLGILAGLDTPTAGRARVGRYELLRMTARERRRYRQEVVGFVWQQTGRNLLPYLSVHDNVELPLRLAGADRATRRERVAELLELVGLNGVDGERPHALSGGDQQRAAVATALANRPEVLLADEPTGELDSESSERMLEVLRRVNTELGTTVLVLTHDPLVSEQVDRTVRIRDGRTANETLRRRTRTAAGEHEVIAQEYAVLDGVGRLQLPREYVDALRLERRVRLELEPDHVGLWPDRARPEEDA